MKSEITKKTLIVKKILISIAASSVLITNVKAVDVNELPSGSQVVHGSVNISTSNNTMNINQFSNKAIVNWNTFNIGSNATVNFIQPSSSSVILNRVISSNPSTINGSINANGQVFLINPNGILFGQNSRVNVGGLVASTMDITNENFVNGNYSFFGNDKNAVIKNYGQLSAEINGYIALLAPEVINEGVIVANKGFIAIGGGNKAKLNFDGLNIVSLEVENDTLDALIKNKHLISAPDGTIIMSVAAANALHAAVINNEGVIEADNLTSKNGKILLTATGDNSNIALSGSITSKGHINTVGGEVRIISDNTVTLKEGANIDVSGGDGGFLAIATKNNLNLLGHYTVKALNQNGEHGWLYTGANTEAAKLMRNPNLEGVASQPDQATVLFEENLGQTDESIDFLTRADGATMYLSAAEAYVALQSGKDAVSTVGMGLININKTVEVIGERELESYSNYFIGNDKSKWIEGAKHFSAVRYKNIYAGIDLLYYGNKNGDIEYDLVVAKGADASKVMLDYTGATSVTINNMGDLVVKIGEQEVIQKAPLTYQIVSESRKIIPSKYILTDGKVNIQTDNYDNTKELIIDPVIEWSSYLGGSSGDNVTGISVDNNGNKYVVGVTGSNNFNTSSGFQTILSGPTDAFITKISSNGSLLWSSYLGGSSYDDGKDISIDSNGNAYITGRTSSNNFNTNNGFQTSYGGSDDGFVAKISSSGSLLWSSYLGGTSYDNGYSISVDSNGNAYVSGETSSSNFNTTNGFQTVYGGSYDGFITKISSSGSILWSSYLGGSSSDIAAGVSVDINGNAYVTGRTNSNNFNTTNGFQTSLSGSNDAFITKLSSTGSLVWSRYLGGSGADVGNGISVDTSGNAYITGYTTSTNFNTTNVFQTTFGGGNSDAFITKISSTGSLVWSSYLGGSGEDVSDGIAVDTSGNIYITGYTESTNFNTTNGFQTVLSGDKDAFITKVSSTGSLVWSSYLGGSGEDFGNGVSVDTSGNVYITGRTTSTNFNTTNGFQTSLSGSAEGFILKLSDPTLGSGSKPEVITPPENVYDNPIPKDPKQLEGGSDSGGISENPSSIRNTFTNSNPAQATKEYLISKGIDATVGSAVAGIATTLLNLQSNNTLKKFFDERYIGTIREVLGDTLGKPATLNKLKEVMASSGTDVLKGAALDTLISIFITDNLKSELEKGFGMDSVYSIAAKDYLLDVATMFIKNAYLSNGNTLTFQAGFTMDMAAFSTSQVIKAYEAKQELAKEENNMYSSFYAVASQADALQRKDADNKIIDNMYSAIESNYLEYYYSNRSSSRDRRVPSSNEIKRIAQISVEIDKLYPKESIMESPQSAEQRAEKLKQLVREVGEMDFANNHDRIILLERLVEGSGSYIDIAQVYRNL